MSATWTSREPEQMAVPRASVAKPRALRRWKVLHACTAPVDIARLLEAQIAAGMAPSLLEAQPHPAARRGLLSAWSDVKQWKQRLAAQAGGVEIVHAHDFASGMAALRGGYVVVYDFTAPVEDSHAGSVAAGAWLRRSMRAAEQFLVTRAGAVVVHAGAMWDLALERGVEIENLFLVPEPVEIGRGDDAEELRRRFVAPRHALWMFAPAVAVTARGVSQELRCLLEAFTLVREELETVRLLLEVEPGADSVMRELLSAISDRDFIDGIAPAQRMQAISAADIVISAAPLGNGPDRFAIETLARGRALLAADCRQTREVTPDGRGCLWFRKGDSRDLGHRAAFLSRNADFRAALVAAGQAHLETTRGPLAVAEMHDAAYRHAFHRRPRPDDFLPARLSMAQA